MSSEIHLLFCLFFSFTVDLLFIPLVTVWVDFLGTQCYSFTYFFSFSLRFTDASFHWFTGSFYFSFVSRFSPSSASFCSSFVCHFFILHFLLLHFALPSSVTLVPRQSLLHYSFGSFSSSSVSHFGLSSVSSSFFISLFLRQSLLHSSSASFRSSFVFGFFCKTFQGREGDGG